MSERNELLARYEILCKRINAVNTDIALELDRERRVTLDERRSELTKERDDIGAQLALVSWEGTDGHTTDVTQQMIDARIQMTENTLRGLDTKMDKLIDQVHDIDTRQRVLEQQVSELKKQIDDVRSQVVLVRTLSDPDLPRTWLLAAGLAVTLALFMLVLITWRVM